MPNQKNELVLQAWNNLKSKIIKQLTSNPAELLNQISSLEQQINQTKQNNPDWQAAINDIKGELHKLEVKKLLLQEKLSYQQNWSKDKLGYEKQLEKMEQK